MSKLKTFYRATIVLFGLLLGACSLVPQHASTQVEAAPNIKITLPTPASLGHSLTASQLITASWQVAGNKKTEQLPVQLQVTNQDVVLAGFSSWGTRILSLSYDGHTVKTEVLNGLQQSLPQPEQVLFNLMLTLWPSSAWEGPLNKVSWRMVDTPYSRTIVDGDGESVIVIQYSSSNHLEGDIEFHHQKQAFSISIQTLQHQIN
ncbi:DUF3261 domain-containing protein [Vibrio mytili]|uniref:Lipoprotein n=1 Tax=Vibrio mytili TaxID=50718 RepID=A0A0C3HVG8_9VIBR|nr:DUF3261 domain-containing protein [Vibrio mytili]KIN12221.1 lipoprotein [Vibrio mytili]